MGALGATTLPPSGSTTFTVTCSPGAIGPRNAALRIASNDSDENPFDITLSAVGIWPEVNLVVSPSSVVEDGTSNLLYTFTRLGAVGGPLTVNFSVGGTASFGNDYTQSGAASFTASAGTVTFAPGSSIATVTIDPAIDFAQEEDETVALTVTGGSGYTVGSPLAATGTITNDDTALKSWRHTFFGNADNSGDGADLNDFDKDGIPNLIEFAFGLDPKQNSTGLLPRPQRNGNNCVVSFSQPVGVSGITYGAEWSQSLLPGNWTAIIDTGNTSASPPQHTFSVPIDTRTQLYMRLKVTSP
jgi:hypothetical protein